MSAELMRAMIDAALPGGSMWRPEPDGDLDKMLDGTAANLETLRLFLAGIKDARNPALTDYLDDLEREFGVLTNLVEFSYDADRDLSVAAKTGGAPTGCAISSDGRWMFTCKGPPSAVSKWELLTPFDTSTAVETVFDLDVSVEVFAATGLDVSADGLHLFVVDQIIPSVHSWTMTSAFMLETASYDVGKSKDVSADTSSPFGIDLSPDGTRFYISDFMNARLLSWTMGTAFEPLSAIIGGIKDVSAQEILPVAIAVADDGSRLWMVGIVNRTIFTYDMSIAGEISSASRVPAFDIFVGRQDGIPAGLSVSPDESALFMIGSEFDFIYSYSPNEPRRREQLHPLVYGRGGSGTIDDMQTALDSAGFDVTVYANDPAIDPDPFLSDAFQMVAGGGNAFAGNAGAFAGRIGGELLVNGDIFKQSRIFTSVAGTLFAGTGHGAGEYVDLLRTKIEYPIPTDPGDWPLVFFVGGAATFSNYIEGQDLFVGAQISNPGSCAISPDGLSMFALGTTLRVFQWDLAIPFVPSSGVLRAISLDVSPQISSPTGLGISEDGLHMFIGDTPTKSVHSWTMTTLFDLNTASYDVGAFIDISVQISFLTGIALNSDGSKFFVCDATTNLLSSWTMGTPFVPSTGVYDGIGKTKNILAEESSVRDLFVSNGGFRVHIVGDVSDTIFTYGMDAKDDLSTADHIPDLDIPVDAQDDLPRGLTTSADGRLLFMIGSEFDSIYSYTSDPQITSIDQAQVSATQEQAFKRIILSKKPAHSWAVLIVAFS